MWCEKNNVTGQKNDVCVCVCVCMCISWSDLQTNTRFFIYLLFVMFYLFIYLFFVLFWSFNTQNKFYKRDFLRFKSLKIMFFFNVFLMFFCFYKYDKINLHKNDIYIIFFLCVCKQVIICVNYLFLFLFFIPLFRRKLIKTMNIYWFHKHKIG